MMDIFGVIMAGGGGTRFWPLSRQEHPKQLLNLSGRELLINETIDRVKKIANLNHIYVVTNVRQREQMEQATKERIDPSHILSEAASRNTAACIGYAAIKILKSHGDGVMAVFPSDHYIADERSFFYACNNAVKVAMEKDCLVTLGIRPTYPSTGYGYIRYEKQGENQEQDSSYKVVEFKEKPDYETAKKYLEDGSYVWNSGMFVWKASVILEEYKRYLPEIYTCLMKMAEWINTPDETKRIDEMYPSIPSVSVDYGVLEKSERIHVIPADMGWSDVGSWDSLEVFHDKDVNGNICVGEPLLLDCKGCTVYSPKKLVAGVGLQDLVIVETEDAILVCKNDRLQEVKTVVEKLEKKGIRELL